MGACASVPKGMRAEAMAAPPPEQRKDETTIIAPEVVEVTEGDNAKLKDEKVAEEKGVDDKHQSLGSLLNESEAVKESAKDEKSSDTKEPKGEELPVSDAAVEASSGYSPSMFLKKTESRLIQPASSPLFSHINRNANIYI